MYDNFSHNDESLSFSGLSIMIENILMGFEIVFTPYNLFFVLIGCLLGSLIGVMPGIGPTASISMLLPLTFYLNPTTGIIFLAGLYYGSQYGGSTTAILLNTPGENSSVMTCIDGYEMTKKGQAGLAIAAAAISSFIAGIIMVFFVATLSPFLSEVALKFGPAEFTMLMLFGLVSITILTGDNLLKGITVSLLGVLLSTIGTDINSGVDRFTFGILELTDKVNFAIIAIGMFAFPEIIKNLQASEILLSVHKKLKLIPSIQDLKRIIPSSLRGTLVGGLLGLIPGGGITTASYAAYVFDKKVSRNKSKFGQGIVEGVAAPEAANNAAAQSGFIPLLSLGLPENAVMSLILSFLIVSGVTPGPMMIQQQPELFWGLVISMIVGNAVLLLLNFPLIKIWIQILKIPYHILYVLILIIGCIGVLAITNNINSIFLLAFFSLLGYIFYILNLSPIAFILGYILGPMLEENFRRTLIISQGDFSVFYQGSINITLFILIILLIWTYFSKINKV